MQRNRLAMAGVLGMILGLSRGVTAQIIYDNTTTSLGNTSFTAQEQGDEIHLPTPSALISKLEIGVFQQGVAGTTDLMARLYANDGAEGEPGLLLWESALLDDVNLSGGFDLIAFAVPSVQVPEKFTWTIQISDSRPIAVGLPHFHPPTTGNSPDYAWFGSPNDWTKLELGAPVNYMARITAVPEPGHVGLLLTSVGTALFLRRRRQQTSR